MNNLILIAAGNNFYAISPANQEEFMLAYHRFAELGSLTPLTSHSIYPANLLRQVWAARSARYLLISGIVVAVLLLVLVILIVPSSPTISLGFNPDGTPSEPGPSVFLLLIPLLNTVFYFTNLSAGLYLFRSQERKILAYLLWGSGLFTGLLFIIAVLFILRGG